MAASSASAPMAQLGCRREGTWWRSVSAGGGARSEQATGDQICEILAGDLGSPEIMDGAYAKYLAAHETGKLRAPVIGLDSNVTSPFLCEFTVQLYMHSEKANLYINPAEEPILSEWRRRYHSPVKDQEFPPFPPTWCRNVRATCTCSKFHHNVESEKGELPECWCEHILGTFFKIAERCDQNYLFAYLLSGHDFEDEELYAAAVDWKYNARS